MQPDSTFLTQATTAGEQRGLDDQRRGIILSPPQLLQLAQDFAGLALVQERLTHPHQAAKPCGSACRGLRCWLCDGSASQANASRFQERLLTPSSLPRHTPSHSTHSPLLTHAPPAPTYQYIIQERHIRVGQQHVLSYTLFRPGDSG
ncbi:hypothetical protein KSF_104270 [Reticulibacter mediterranei]|uniref:Uncharacterized protein n=1 Tax=Reticulibacter mediterranei TaxID=2778369 RepID=A0A8J3IR06_9CHLR|nr:hypothetical protein [Reticulibacter mediterranei]GHP00380.1 hypothetical protein KSF_104270 [Reticulibacter mediterranei]